MGALALSFAGGAFAIEVGQTNRDRVSCPAQGDASAETGNAGADDDNLHFVVLIEVVFVLRLESTPLSLGAECLICARYLPDLRQFRGQ